MKDYQSWDAKRRADHVASDVLTACMAVHSRLGPGLLESVYQECVRAELGHRGISCTSQVQIPIFYDGRELATTLRLDLVVEDLVIVELKAVERLEPVHTAQLLTYLRLSHRWLGLLLNFNTAHQKEGIRRVVS